MADMKPNEKIRTGAFLEKVVRIKPVEYKSMPATSTRLDPYLSAIQPAIGWINPQKKCPKANARLSGTIPI